MLLIHSPLLCVISVSTLASPDSNDGICTMAIPCRDMTGRTVFKTSARSAYLLLKCGLFAVLLAFSISA